MIIKGDDAYTLKKENVAYWDELDATVEYEVEKIVKKLEDFSATPFSCDESAIAEISKEVTSLLVEKLEKHYGATFPFVDCDY